MCTEKFSCEHVFVQIHLRYCESNKERKESGYKMKNVTYYYIGQVILLLNKYHSIILEFQPPVLITKRHVDIYIVFPLEDLFINQVVER